MESPLLRRLAVVPAAGLLCALYLANLTGMGMFGPDEPRYADIGRAMARTGDWVTPRLWGQPWFEKPALLYWMTGAGFRLGLGPDLAPRLPVALLSVVFLCFFWWRVRTEWDARSAWYAAGMLATSAGWLTYSHVAVTDLPMSVLFSAAVLLALPWVERGDAGGLIGSAACLGLATVAKGLVPVVLFLPVWAVGWKRLGKWLRPGPVIAFSVSALPWYVLCTMRNGGEFLQVFFLQQQFDRFRTSALQHVQPVWFYIPVLMVLLFPWFPLLAFPSVAFPTALRRDRRIRTLGLVVVFGFIFFSASVNKLYGYLLPLLPSVFVLLGAGIARARRPGMAVIPTICLLGALPVLSGYAPLAMAPHGTQAISVSIFVSVVPAVLSLVVAGIIGAALVRFAPAYSVAAATALAALGFVWFQFAIFPVLDRYRSARPLWEERHPTCTSQASRDTVYGLSYYAGYAIPPCAVPADRRSPEPSPVLDQGGIRVVR